MKAAFIDRDGVVNEERDYVYRIEDFKLLPGVREGLKLLQQQGWKLVIVTNQAGIARGFYTEGDFERLTAHMRALLSESGIVIDAVYHCPHHPTAGVGAARLDCTCRKPQPGMLLQASAELGITLTESVIVGDKLSDLEAGRAAGLAACVLVESGHAPGPEARAAADHVAPGLHEAARWIVGHV